jgi:hypothetical protein
VVVTGGVAGEFTAPMIGPAGRSCRRCSCGSRRGRRRDAAHAEEAGLEVAVASTLVANMREKVPTTLAR